MDEELKAQLITYQAQLEQVNLALAADPANAEELKNYKTQLESMVVMATDLLQFSEPNKKQKQKWKVGKVCEAFMSKDNCYKVCKIKEIFDNGSCSVAFGRYTEIVQLDSLKQTNKLDPETEKKKEKKRKFEEKKKFEDDVMEKSKNDWLKHQKKAGCKKSIFSTSDNGKVGVGTNKVADRPRAVVAPIRKMKKGVQM